MIHSLLCSILKVLKPKDSEKFKYILSRLSRLIKLQLKKMKIKKDQLKAKLDLLEKVTKELQTVPINEKVRKILEDNKKELLK